MRVLVWFLLLAALAAACGNGGSSQPDADAADSADVEPDTEPEAEADVEPDVIDDVEAEAEATTPDPCSVLGLPERDFDDEPDDEHLYATAHAMSLEDS